MMMTVTAKGQVTFRKEILQHLGVKPGEKIDLQLLPDGGAKLSKAKQTGTIEAFIGALAGKTKKKLTIEQISQAAADGWAGKR